MLTDVVGVRVGHWSDPDAATGCTAIIPPPGTVGAVDVRGGGPGTRETDVLGPLAGAWEVSALMLAGGSAHGLSTASGAMRWCEENGIGLDVGVARVPIVPAAIIFDLGVATRRPGADEGYAACAAAADGPHAVGSVGAGTGATVGKLLGRDGWCKGGVGAASVVTLDGVTVAALAVVNAFGDVVDERGEVIAGAWQAGCGFVRAWEYALTHPPVHPRLAARASTTLVCVATDGRLTKAEATHVARMAHAGVCRAVSPVHTPFDGDVVFCLATGARPAAVTTAGIAAAEVSARAIRHAVRCATSVAGVPTGAERG
ncbi:MAG: P1 family peptidase [Actinomycetota bacterium]